MAIKVMEKACGGPFEVRDGVLQPLGKCRHLVRIEVEENEENDFAARILDAVSRSIRCDWCAEQGKTIMAQHNRHLEDMNSGKKTRLTESKKDKTLTWNTMKG